MKGHKVQLMNKSPEKEDTKLGETTDKETLKNQLKASEDLV